MGSGLSPNRAAPPAGVSKTFAYELVKKMGGVMILPEQREYSPRYLSREERWEIARLLEAGLRPGGVAARLGRAASTVSRELKRNTDPRAGRYQPELAHRLARRR